MRRVFDPFRKALRQFSIEKEGVALEQDLALPAGGLVELLSARPYVRDQMERMAEVQGVRPNEIDSERWRALDIVQKCQHCDLVKGCNRFLDGKETAFALEDCPNTRNYSEILENVELRRAQMRLQEWILPPTRAFFGR